MRLTETEKSIGRELISGGCRNYSAKAAQIDLDRLCGETYTLDGDCHHGYFIRHNATGRTVISKQSPRYLVICAIGLYRAAYTANDAAIVSRRM